MTPSNKHNSRVELPKVLSFRKRNIEISRKSTTEDRPGARTKPLITIVYVTIVSELKLNS